MNPHLQRALMLLEQSRYDMAEDELRKLLASDPDDAMAHAVLALTLARSKKYADAVAEAENAIHLAPDQPFVHYAHSVALSERNDKSQAVKAVETAIGMDPYNVNFFAQLAQLKFGMREWQAAQEAAEAGLDLDPEDVACTNLRAMALVKLGKSIEAGDALGTALKRAPEDAFSHANMGWSFLEQNKPEQAMEHFREALRLDPEMEWARAGIVEAMKARYFLYRLMLNWFLWMVKLKQKAQAGVIIGMFVGYNLLRRVANNNPDWAPWIWPILIAYIAFAVMTWMASPLFNLVLRTSKFGRLALSDEEIRTSTWVGLCVLGSLSMLGCYFVTGSATFLQTAFACALIIPPLAALYHCEEGWPRAVITLITIGLGGLALLIAATMIGSYFFEGQAAARLENVGLLLSLPFVVGAIATQFLVSFLASATPRRGSESARIVWWVGGLFLAVGAIAILAVTCLGVLYAFDEDPLVFNVPLRSQLIQDDDLPWANPERLQADTKEFEDTGFRLVGDFRPEGIPETRMRILLDSDGVALGITEDPFENYAHSFSVYLENGVFEYSNSPVPQPAQPSSVTRRYFDLPALELFERFDHERPREGVRVLTAENVRTEFERSYRREIDFQLSRGGPTAAEIRAMSAYAIGAENISDSRIERIQRLWRKQASAKISEFVTGQMRESDADFDSESRFICIHELLTMDEISALANIDDDFRKLRQTQDDGAKIDQIITSNTRRDAFAEIAALIPRLKKVRSLEEPLPMDVYQLDGSSETAGP